MKTKAKLKITKDSNVDNNVMHSMGSGIMYSIQKLLRIIIFHYLL